MPTCPHCGRGVRGKDRFCIFCGKPLLAGLDKSKKEVKVEVEKENDRRTEPKKKPRKEELELEEDKEEISITKKGKKGEEGLEAEEIEEEESKKGKKKKDKKDYTEITPLTEETKKQLEVVVDLKDVKKKKKRLKEKFDDLQKLLDDERYEADMDFTKEVNLKFEALKEIKEELTLKEQELKAAMGGEFTYDTFQKIIAEKKEQLNNLTKSFKLRKVDKDIFQNLKKEYMEELEQAKADLKDLKLSIKLWVAKLEAEKVDVRRDLKLVKARLSSNEISEEEYLPISKEFEANIKKLSHKIEVLSKYTKDKEK